VQHESVSPTEAWSRFSGFADGVIRSVELRLDGSRRASVELDAQEPPNSDGPWWRVRFDLTGLAEWRFEQIRSDMLVVFDARLETIGDLTYVSFDAATLPEEPSVNEFRTTCAYAAAERVEILLRRLR
jgi:hypothetical protein